MTQATNTKQLLPGASLWRIVVVNDGPNGLGQIPMIEFRDPGGAPIHTTTALKTSSSSAADHGPEFAFDSVGGTYWQAGTSSKVGQYLELDFGAPVNIAKLVYTSYLVGNHSVKDMATAFDLQYYDEYTSAWVTHHSLNQSHAWSVSNILATNSDVFTGLEAGQGDTDGANEDTGTGGTGNTGGEDTGTGGTGNTGGEDTGTGGTGNTGGEETGSSGTGNTGNEDTGVVETARVYLTPGSQTFGPIPGGALSETFGSNQAETVKLAADANVIFDPSFVRGNDSIVILGNAGDYNFSATLAGITITSGNGASIRIPAFGDGGGLKIDFANASFDLVTNDNGATFTLEGESGNQVHLNVSNPATPGSADFSLDVGTPAVAKTVDAGAGDVAFSDDAALTTNVLITGLGLGDSITVTNATSGDYNFNRDFSDINDLVITFTDQVTGATNAIVIDNVLPNTGPVNSYASATAAIGFDFMTFA